MIEAPLPKAYTDFINLIKQARSLIMSYNDLSNEGKIRFMKGYRPQAHYKVVREMNFTDLNRLLENINPALYAPRQNRIGPTRMLNRENEQVLALAIRDLSRGELSRRTVNLAAWAATGLWECWHWTSGPETTRIREYIDSLPTNL